MLEQKNILLFDGVCNLCNGTVNWLIDRDKAEKILFCSLQSVSGQGILEKYGLEKTQFDSVVLLSHGVLYQKSDAALEVCRLLGGGWRFLYFFKIVPAFIRHYFYDLVAQNRYRWFGKTEFCRVPTPDLKKRFLE